MLSFDNCYYNHLCTYVGFSFGRPLFFENNVCNIRLQIYSIYNLIFILKKSNFLTNKVCIGMYNLCFENNPSPFLRPLIVWLLHENISQIMNLQPSSCYIYFDLNLGVNKISLSPDLMYTRCTNTYTVQTISPDMFNLGHCSVVL